ncbi:MAG: hypothetical protein WC242_05510 [Candidatus Paceibacterota bacterium]|jgi:hypothetical protein
MRKPYIGITGITKPSEVRAALSVLPENGNRKLMVGVLVTWKSIRGINTKPQWAKQMPDPPVMNPIFLADKRVVNLVHFSTEEGREDSVLADLLGIGGLAGSNFGGFQLNLAWPDIRMMKQYREYVGFVPRIVLQIGQKAIETAGGPQGIVERLSPYIDANLINDILLDPSGGLGKPFDTERAREILREIKRQNWHIGLGVAGGLGPDSLGLVQPLVEEFPELSIDAQGRLRNAEYDLDIEATKTYVIRASQMFSQALTST